MILVPRDRYYVEFLQLRDFSFVAFFLLTLLLHATSASSSKCRQALTGLFKMGGSASSRSFKEIVEILVTEEVKGADNQVWDELWTFNPSVAEIYSEISPTLARKLVTKQPNNTKRLFKQAVAQISQVVEMEANPIYFQQSLSCVRILAKLMPYLLEIQSKSEYVQRLFWNAAGSGNKNISSELVSKERDSSTGADQSGEASKTSSPSIASAANESSSPSMGVSPSLRRERRIQASPPLATILLRSIFHLCFLPSFTIPPLTNLSAYLPEDVDSPDFKAALMWNMGVQSAPEIRATSSSSSYDQNRIDVLRLLVSTLIGDVFTPFHAYSSSSNAVLSLACGYDMPYAEILFLSLLNSVLGFDPVERGIGGILPFLSSSDASLRRSLAITSLDSLLILLSFGHSHDTCLATPANAQPSSSSSSHDEVMLTKKGKPLPLGKLPGRNVFRRFLSNICQNDDLTFIMNGFQRLFQYLVLNKPSTTPPSPTSLELEEFEMKLVFLFWKLLNENLDFFEFFVSHAACHDIAIGFFLLRMMENRKDASKLNFIYLCTLILLQLSSHRHFAITLNQPCNATTVSATSFFPSLISILHFTEGAQSDVLVIAIHKLIVSGADEFFPLYSSLLTIISNISPYVIQSML